MAPNEVPQRELTIREQAALEVRKEQGARALKEMKKILTDLAAAEAVVKGFEIRKRNETRDFMAASNRQVFHAQVMSLAA